ncbi:MAG: ABC transporter ATP-binding protein [Deltaproteobacteria bacterium]|nr:ABC transporter ATP-binding protein [Deltaproteobacteria bacterium]MBN2673261.1 ABC transporter ATP-binding protein [Deltaproteobacteria bacterium]
MTQTQSNDLLLDIQHLTKEYEHRGKIIPVLKNLELKVKKGEMCAIVGASGVGKSTFLNVVGTLDAPTRGQIRVNGADITRLSAQKLSHFRNKTIGFVFQFHYLLPEFTALENVMMPGMIQRNDKGNLRKEAEQMLNEVGLSHRLTHKPGELSGGEQQRVALARALVLRPPLLLADEPTGNLDSKTAAGIHDLFFDMNRKYNTSMLMVTHNLELASRMPRALELANGTVTDIKAASSLL